MHLHSGLPSSLAKAGKVQIRQGEGAQGGAVTVPDPPVAPVVLKQLAGLILKGLRR